MHRKAQLKQLRNAAGQDITFWLRYIEEREDGQGGDLSDDKILREIGRLRKITGLCDIELNGKKRTKDVT
jgi:hypothetical protein